MKLKLFEQFIGEGSYKTLADYLVGAPKIKSRLSPTATHMITGSYFDMFGTLRVDLKLTEIATSKIVATAAGEGQGTDVSIFLFKALGALSAKITDPKITISSGQFPLAPNITIGGVKTSLTKSE
jgi:hypothetical protein